MAKVELNIVALGDFSSVNAQIKSLQDQVAILQKNMAGVGVSSSFAKELANINAVFKQTMLSTGQFTASTVTMTSETDKFGQALVTGKLKLTEYYNIIKMKSSEAVTQMKALAVEQTKLQNSIVMNDPSKQGILSVYTPTQIDKVANATKIAANEANLYALAVKKGSQELINWGKNTQWAGRQLTVGMSVPLMIFGQQAVQSFKDVNTELTRLQRLYGEGLTPPSQTELNQISDQVMKLGKDIAGTMGIAQTETVKAAANFAAMGRQGQDLLTTTAQTMRLSKLGAVSTADATNTVVALQNVYKVSTYQLADAVNFLSDIQKQTTMTLGDMTQAIPRVGPIMQQLGGTYQDTAVMLVAMREAGIPAAQAANAVKSAIASMIAPTAAASKEFAQYGINLTAIKTNTQGNPVKMIEALQAGMAKLSPLVKEQLIEKLFGKFQFARVSALLDNFGKIGSQTQNALKIAGATSSELATLANQEMKQATESPTARYQRALESFKATLVPVGQEIIKIATRLMDFGNAIGKIFSGLPGPVKSVMGALAIGVTISGPIIMLTGLVANFAGFLLKGLFNLKQLATGGKTLGTLLTPELVAAQNANELFQAGITGDVEAVNLLSKAIQDLTLNIQQMVASFTTGTGFGRVLSEVATNAKVYEQMHLPGFASGGIVPGSGSGKVDSVPAMLAPGELVVDAETTKKYWPLLNGVINGKIPGYAEGNKNEFKDVYYSKDYAAPSSLQGGASALAGEDYPKIVQISESIIQEFDLLNQSLIKVKPGKTIEAARQQVYNQAVQMDLGHLTPAEKDASGKPYRPTQLAGVTHPENQTIEQLVPGQALNRYVKETTDNMVSGVVKTGLSKEKIEDAARRIQLGQQPIDQAGMEVYARILQTIRQKVKSGQLQIQPGAVSNALLAEGTMTARMFPGEASSRNLPSVSNPRLLSSITPGFLSEFRKQKKIYLEELSSAAQQARVEGEKLATGYFAGIKTKMPEAQSVATAFTTTVINGVKRTQKSASKSRVAQQLGLNFGQGYDFGILSTTPQATQAGQQLAMAAVTGVEEETAAAVSTGRMSGLKNRLMPGGKMSNLLKFGASSAIMMGGQAITSMLPKGSNASAIGSDAAAGASLGMFAGPEGAALGAALGAAVGGVSALIRAEKEQSAQAKATFTSSADAVQMLGGTLANTTHNMIQFNDTVDAVSNSDNHLSKGLTVSSEQIKSFADSVSKLPKDNPLSQVMQRIKDTSDNGSAVKIAQQFAATQMAINGISQSQANSLIQLMLTASGHQASGSTNGTPATQLEAIKRTLQSLKPDTKEFSTFVGTLTDMAVNTNSWEAYKAAIDAIGSSALSSGNYVKGLIAYLNAHGDTQGASTVQNLSAYGYTGKEIAMMQTANKLGISLATSAGQQGLAFAPNNAKDDKAINDAIQAAQAKNSKDQSAATAASAAAANGTGGTVSQTTMSKELKAQIKTLTDKKKIIDAELKTQKDITTEMQRQMQYQNAQVTAAEDAKTALEKGDYIQAAQLKQQAAYNTMSFNAQTKANSLQNQSDALSNQIADLNDQQDKLTQAIQANSSAVAANTAQQVQKDKSTPLGVTNIDYGKLATPDVITSLGAAYNTAKAAKVGNTSWWDGGKSNFDPSQWNNVAGKYSLGLTENSRGGITKLIDSQYKPGSYVTFKHNDMQYLFHELANGTVNLMGTGKIGEIWDKHIGKFVKASVNLSTPSVPATGSASIGGSVASGGVQVNIQVQGNADSSTVKALQATGQGLGSTVKTAVNTSSKMKVNSGNATKKK